MTESLTSQLWFDVEEGYNTTFSRFLASRQSCGLM